MKEDKGRESFLCTSLRDIDWAQLRKQKLWLCGKKSRRALGLINLIDCIQDGAVRDRLASEQEVFHSYVE